MFADPQFWVAVSFLLFIVAIFNPVRKILKLSLDTKIDEIKNKIKEAENIKSDAQKTLSELKSRESEVEKEIKELLVPDTKRKYIICLKDDCYTPIKNFTKKCPTCSISINKESFNL